ncbi:MAG: late competence development ComFB family protein [Spirochaetaceae bacterium]|jgi:competence protein ComFB|nr:late competence development ComFB family protein [Spirochaetaceae bacterium]
MELLSKYDFENLRNESEGHVLAELERQINAIKGEICRCNDCIVDMAAMALNNVRPLYRCSILGTLYAQEAMNDKVYAENVRDAVWEALIKIKKNPSHE